MPIKEVPIHPVVTFDFLDNPPDEGGMDPFVVGNMTTGALASFVKAKVYARISQNPLSDDTPASTSVNAHQTFVIDVYWKLSGPSVSKFDGNWKITIYFESLGPDDYDFEIVTPDESLIPYDYPEPPNTDKNTRIYHAVYTVPADTVQTKPNGTPYELNVSLALLSKSDQHSLELVGSVPLRVIYFFSF